MRRTDWKWLLSGLIVLNFFFGVATSHSFAQQKSEVAPPAKVDRAKGPGQRGKAEKAEAADFDPARVDALKNEIQAALDGLKIEMELVETEHLLVFADLGPEETASIAELAEKSFVSSCRLLEIADTKALFPTKFALLVLDKDQFFEALQKVIFRTSSTASRSVLWRTVGDSPCLLVSNQPAAVFRTPGFSNNWREWTARFIGTVVLLKKFPADATHSELPVWIRNGFGLYASLVAQDDPEVMRTYRVQIRERMPDKVKMFDFSTGPKEFYNFHVASVVEYLLAVQEDAGFEELVSLLQKQKVVRDERVSLDLKSELGWDRDDMERRWRYYAKMGKRLAR